MPPGDSDPFYLKKVSEAIYGALSSADPSAIWVMQAWLFYSDLEFWTEDNIKVKSIFYVFKFNVICFRVYWMVLKRENYCY